ncbi:MAG: DUF86 domain-containing protein [Chitinivibrionales bacterium]|nr:DUF86 domain-containing protein [Chitinivibrionales bacterium]
MRNDDLIRLRHMYEAAEEVTQYVNEYERKDLDTDRMLLHSLVHCIQIGEAAGRVSKETQAELPSLPWPEMVGMRNHLTHVYFDINHDILWATGSGHIPSLLLELRGIPGVSEQG